MPQAKPASREKRPSKVASVLGIAGVSFTASTGGSPANIPPASLVSPAAGSVADLLWGDAAPFRLPTLDEEEISDVSLATFHLFDKDDLGRSQSGIQVAFRSCGGGCGCGHGCGGGGFRGCGGGGFRGCAGGGFRGCAGGCRGCGVGFRGCRGCGVGFGGCGCGGGCGGCGWGWGWGGGCCLSWGGCALC
jgi:hypothetical protein